MLTVENQLGNVCHHKHGYFYHYEVNIWIYVFLFQSKHWQKTRLLDQNVDVAVLKLVTSDWNVDHLCHLRNSWILNKDHSSNLHPGDHNMWNNDQFIWKMEGARPPARSAASAARCAAPPRLHLFLAMEPLVPAALHIAYYTPVSGVV